MWIGFHDDLADPGKEPVVVGEHHHVEATALDRVRGDRLQVRRVRAEAEEAHLALLPEAIEGLVEGRRCKKKKAGRSGRLFCLRADGTPSFDGATTIYADGFALTDETLAMQFRLHLHRGIAYLASDRRLRNVASLYKYATPARSPARQTE